MPKGVADMTVVIGTMATSEATSGPLLTGTNFSSTKASTGSRSSSVPPAAQRCVQQGPGRMLKVPSLVFDLELGEDGMGTCRPEGAADVAEDVKEIKRFLKPSTAAEIRLAADVQEVVCEQGTERVDTSNLAQSLSNLGYVVSVRNALGGGEGSDCLRNLRHSFVLVSLPGLQDRVGVRAINYIVDAHFKEQFAIGKATERYAAILDGLPEVLVLPESNVAQLVNFLCSEIVAAFKSNGAVLPPWRQASSMLSKWQPRKSLDEPVGRFAALTETMPHYSPLQSDSRRTISASQVPIDAPPFQVFRGGNFPISALI